MWFPPQPKEGTVMIKMPKFANFASCLAKEIHSIVRH